MLTNTETITAELSTGKSVPLRPARAKSGNAYHSIIHPNTKNPVGQYGIKVAKSVIGDTLPTHVIIDGTKFAAEKGTTTSGNAKVVFSGKVKVDGEDRNLFFQVSALDSGDYNVMGRISRNRGKGAPAATSL